MNGYVYLIQPCELLGTKRYKIGCSKQENLSRLNSYKKGSRYISIYSCDNPLLIEKEIKNIFNNKYKLIAGTEYYEGDEIEMKKDFLEIFTKNVKIIDNQKTTEPVIDKKINEKNIKNKKLFDEYLGQFIITKNKEDQINISELWNIFKIFFNENESTKRPIITEFKKYIDENLDYLMKDQTYYYGIKYNND